MSSLPAHTTSFVGREYEIAEVTRLLDRARLLTLTGVGGGGKTRLALRVAAGLLDSYPDGVWFVEFGPLSDPSLVVQTAATVLGITEEPGRTFDGRNAGSKRLARHDLRPVRLRGLSGDVRDITEKPIPV